MFLCSRFCIKTKIISNEKKGCFHVYWGTQGNGGLYLDEIYQVLKSVGISQDVFVSYYYPLAYGKKVFFKYTDLISGKKRNRLSLVSDMTVIGTLGNSIGVYN